MNFGHILKNLQKIKSTISEFFNFFFLYKKASRFNSKFFPFENIENLIFSAFLKIVKYTWRFLHDHLLDQFPNTVNCSAPLSVIREYPHFSQFWRYFNKINEYLAFTRKYFYLRQIFANSLAKWIESRRSPFDSPADTFESMHCRYTKPAL